MKKIEKILATIIPDIERNMYKRSGTKITEVKGSHVIFISQAAAVANVIISAAEAKNIRN